MTPEERAAANVARMLWASVLKELKKTPDEHILYVANSILADLGNTVKSYEAQEKLDSALAILMLGRN